MKIKYIK